MKYNFIAYQGKVYTIEWYFDARGKSKAKEYFGELTKDRQKKTLNLFKLLADAGQIFNEEKFRSEGDKIYAFKPFPDRFLCFFFEGSKVIVTNGFEKKAQKFPPNEKERSLKAKDDYIKRCKKGTYYD